MVIIIKKNVIYFEMTVGTEPKKSDSKIRKIKIKTKYNC